LYEALRFAGGWDTMSFVTPGAHFLAWHKRKLGWLAPTQVVCLTGSGPIEETLTPASAAGGLKAVVVPTSTATAYVIEVRDQTGEDGRLCSSGVLIYTVSASIANGSGPITVKPAHNGTDPELIDQCGPLYDAPFGIGPGQVSSFSDATVPLTVEVLASAPDNGYVVRVSRQAAGSATLTVTKSGSGKVTSSPAGINCGTDCSQTFAINEAVSLSAIPAAGWKLSAWSGNADCGDGNVIMDADKTCTATFSPLPDLVVSALVAPAGAAPGANITITDTTKNLGLGGAVATTTAYYLSINNKYEASDRPLGSRSVPALAAGAIQKESAGVVIPADATAGPYYLLARADAGTAEVEKSETNNVRAKAIAIGPDLTIATISGPTGAPAGSSVTFTVTTKNQIAPAGGSTTSVYLSLNNKFDGGDELLGSKAITPLNAGAQLKLNFTVTIPGGAPPANYFILARADASAQVTEGNEANNVRAKAFTVTP